MEITWNDPSGNTVSEKIGAAYAPIVEAVGLETAVKFYQHFACQYIYIDGVRSKRAEIAKVMGVESAQKITDALCKYYRGRTSVRVMSANKLLARYYRSLDLTTQEIARMLRVTDVTVRSYLWSDKRGYQEAQRRDEKRKREILEEAIQQGIVVPVSRSDKGASE